MSNRVVTSVLARCLLDSTFLDSLAADSRVALRDYDLGPDLRAMVESLDVDRVRWFAAFIAKVQHNFLWEAFPQTVRALKLHGIELEVFAAYLPLHLELRRRGDAGKEEKIGSFLSFLRDHLGAGREPASSSVLDVLAHEEAEWNVRCAIAACSPAATPAGPPSSYRSLALRRLVPAVRGALRVVRFGWDPTLVIAGLTRGRREPSRAAWRPHHAAYWGDLDSQSLRVFELDAVSAALLAEVDGRRSLRTVACRAAKAVGAMPAATATRALFAELADQGVVSLAVRRAH